MLHKSNHQIVNGNNMTISLSYNNIYDYLCLCVCTMYMYMGLMANDIKVVFLFWDEKVNF